MNVLSTYSINAWDKPLKEEEQQSALISLEAGKVLLCPQLCFQLLPKEQVLFIPCNLDTKNISFDASTNSIKGIQGNQKHGMQLKPILARFSQQARIFMNSLFPLYASMLIVGRTSYRPVQIKNRKSSAYKDDSRLHIDAFHANPNQGKRILRLFCNINPYGQDRVWRLGEAFPDVANRFLPKISKPIPGIAKFLHWVGLTKGIRSHYDHIMLEIHNRMKLDMNYQKQVKYTEVCFPSGASWIVSTDSVSHAAMSGQYVLEQTFLLPVTAMQNPVAAPLRILENLLGSSLV